MYVWQMNDGRWQVSATTHWQYSGQPMPDYGEFAGGYPSQEKACAALQAWKEKMRIPAIYMHDFRHHVPAWHNSQLQTITI